MTKTTAFESFFKKAFAFHRDGNFLEAEKQYLFALKEMPSSGVAHRNLSLIKTYQTEEDEQLVTAAAQLNDDNLAPIDRYQILYAVGKALDDLADYDQAFECFKSAGLLKRHLDNYKYESDKAIFYSLAATAERELKNLKPLSLDSAIRPVFIVGMPRSGTSLVEQILSMHSEVCALGELEYANKYGFKLAIGVEHLNRKALKTFRRKYLGAVTKHSPYTQVFTDKMPLNFRYLKLLSLAFPEAIFVHVTRDPRAVCWSNFRHFFASDGMRFSSTLTDITNYYRDYGDLCKIWQGDSSINLFTLDYESLVTDHSSEVKRLLAHIGLKFESPCLTPEKSKRAINTASQAQVMKPIYTDSSRQWLNYSAHLKPYFLSL